MLGVLNPSFKKISYFHKGGTHLPCKKACRPSYQWSMRNMQTEKRHKEKNYSSPANSKHQGHRHQANSKHQGHTNVWSSERWANNIMVVLSQQNLQCFMQQLYPSSQSAKDYDLWGLNNRKVFYNSSRGWKSKIKVLAVSWFLACRWLSSHWVLTWPFLHLCGESSPGSLPPLIRASVLLN